MARTPFSPSWYRVADLRPRLRAHARLHRHRVRGQIWHILQDDQTGRFHRLSPAAHQLVCLLDGRRTVREPWALVGQRLGAGQPTQDETIRLLAQLHGPDLLTGEVPPDMGELGRRSDRQASRGLLLKLRNPLALRLPLFDPDPFLTATMPLVRPLFTVAGFLGWLALVVAGAVLAAQHWAGLNEDVTQWLLTGQNLALIAVVYPVMKLLHELGHAYATKAWGGEVRETGLMLLVLVPVPYVDASASSAFREPWRRAVVGGAGIMVEAALAAAAVIVWVLAEPSTLRAVAVNVALIGGVSTLLFNGSPLLRFDGYYVLSDLAGLPNLGMRANRYVIYLAWRYGLGLRDAPSPVTGPGERGWFVAYALGAFAYRIVITLTALDLARTLSAGGRCRVFAGERQVELDRTAQDRLAELTDGRPGPWANPLLAEQLVLQALSALHLFHRGEHYLVQGGKVQIVDEYTGRLMADRFWSEGLHQLVEVKEGCPPTGDRVTLARLTYQRFFRRYRRLAGMTGTASEVAAELWQVYRLRVVKISTNRPSRRIVAKDRVLPDAAAKWAEVTVLVAALHARGVPVLVGTRSVAASEDACRRLTAAGLPHEVLNAAQDAAESLVVAQAGEGGRITVATNMAGRGTDIRLGDGVAGLGGLHVVMTERHDARRIDRQLAGRSGRQGEPGWFGAVLALDDAIFAADRPDPWRAVARWLAAAGWTNTAERVGRLAMARAQQAAERRHARMRHELLVSDEMLADVLAFTGPLE